jgi:hypothetical protein
VVRGQYKAHVQFGDTVPAGLLIQGEMNTDESAGEKMGPASGQLQDVSLSGVKGVSYIYSATTGVIEFQLS